MKCAPVLLLNRSEYNKTKRKYNKNNRNLEPVFITKEYHGYSFTFLRSRSSTPSERPILSVKNLQFPENVSTYNTGYSLEKWAKKIPRLKSGNISYSTRSSNGIEQDYDITLDVDNVLDCLEETESQEDLANFNEDIYDVQSGKSDIEELLRKSLEIRKEQEQEAREKGKNAINEKKTGERKRNKHKLRKTIRFSFSKPASPNTEQIIRVDVTSNVSVEELNHPIAGNGNRRRDDCSKGHRKMINETGEKGTELDSGFSENDLIKFDEDADEFVIRCSQLALTHRRR